MAQFDMPLDELVAYRPDLAVPDDLADFWRSTLTGDADRLVSCTVIDNRLSLVDTYDVTFRGFDDAPIRAWLHVPAGATGPLPTVLSFLGYSGGRDFPFHDTLHAQAGRAQLIMDTRGQSFSTGGWEVTPDPWPGAGVNHAPGLMSSGILDRDEYYYRRVFADAFHLVQLARTLSWVDPQRIVLTGPSQGGGITIAVAGLAGLLDVPLAGACPDVPFLSDFPRAVALTDRHPYAEIAHYLRAFRDHHEQALATLAHFDVAVLGRWAAAPALFSVGLADPICPPSTVYAAYNFYGEGRTGDRPAKQIAVYPHNEHDGGGNHHTQTVLDWIATRVR